MMKLSIHDATTVTTIHKGPLRGACADTSTTDIEIKHADGQTLVITLFHEGPIVHQAIIQETVTIKEES